jgi:hypothetical protein
MEGAVMGHKARILAAFWVVEWSLLALAGEPTQRNPQLTVFVTDSANAPEQVVVAAERNAARIFHQAGVEVDWVNCVGPAGSPSQAQCSDNLMRVDLLVRIVPHARTLGDDIFGVSFLDHDTGTYADLFFEPIEKLHEQNRDISLALILGDVLAHELGHLLLGSNAHSRDGIMQPHWTREQLKRGSMGQIRFNKEQSARMRTRIATFHLEHQNSPTLEAANR